MKKILLLLIFLFVFGNGSAQIISCGTPTAPSTSAINTTTATLSWQTISGAISYTIQYRRVGITSWSSKTSTTNTKSLTGLVSATAYEFQVRSTCLLSTSAYSTLATFTTFAPCGIPSALTASSITNTSATLSWQAVSGATSYNIRYRPTGTTTWATATSTDTSKSILNLLAVKTYEFQVQASCNVTGSFSASTNFTTLINCGVPSTLSASSITNTSALLSWQVVSDATSYNIRYRPVGTSTWAMTTSTTNSKSILNLLAAKSYEFQVQATCNAAGAFSASSNFTTQATCGIPSTLKAASITTSSATLSWLAVSGAISYNIQYRPTGTTTWIATTSTTSSKAITNLLATTTYEFQVQTVCVMISAYSASSNFTTLTPPCGIPSTLTASSITNSTATLSWQAASGATANSFNIRYRPTGTTTWVTTTSTSTSISVTNLLAAKAYEFQVQALCTATSAYSASTNFTALATCGIPSTLSATSITTSSGTLSWQAVSGAISYNIQYRPTGTTTWTTTTSTTTSKSITNLLAAKPYEFQVQTVCAMTSAYSASGNFTTLTPPCNTPSNLVASSITISSALLSWQAVSDATSYNVQYKTISESNWTTLNTITNSINLDNLAVATSYEFKVQALCIATSAYSDTSAFTTLTPNCDVPSALSASNITVSSASLSWQSVPGSTSYDVQYKTIAESNWTTINTTTNDVDLNNLVIATSYEFRVQALCIAISGYSSTANFTTVTPTCEVTSDLTASNITVSSASLSWQVVAGATSYNIQYKTTAQENWTTINSITNSVDLINLAVATSYEFKVQALCIATSVYSDIANFTTLTPTCGVPSALSISNITFSSATISWQAVVGATSYNIQYKTITGENWTTINTITNSFDLTNLAVGISYEFKVQALCIATSVYSDTSTFTTLPLPCEIPNNLSVTSVTASSALVSWQAVLEANSYAIRYRRIGTNSWNTTTSLLTSKSLTGLLESSAYEFQVQAICISSNVFSASTNFTTLTSGTSFIFPANSSWKYLDNGTNQGVAWRDVNFNDASWSVANAKFGYGEGDEATVVSYGPNASNKYVTTYFRKSFSISNPSAYSSLSFDVVRDDGVVVYLNGIEIFRNNLPTGSITNTTYAIVSVGGSDESAWYITVINPASLLIGNNVIAVEIHQQSLASSDLSFNGRLSATIPLTCGAPDSLTTSSIGSSSATLNWQAINGATNYNVQYRKTGSEAWINTTASTNTKAINGLSPDSNYEFRVQAICSFTGDDSAIATFSTRPLTCDAPIVLNASSITSTKSTLSWQEVADAVNYTIKYRQTGQTNWSDISVTTTSKILTGLTPATSYEFKVQAVCSFPSTFSNTYNFTTGAPTCDVPTSLNITSTTSSTVLLTWNEVEGAISYSIEHQLAGTNAWITSTSATNSKTISGLIAKTSYEFRVKAVCSFTGNYTSVLSFTTHTAGTDFLIAPNSAWKYLDNGTNQGTAWRGTSFNDAAWKTGNAKFGYGEGDETTIVDYGPNPSNKYVTTYFRNSFTVDDPSNYTGLSMDVVRDDGVVVYVNGTEVYRNNLPTTAIESNTFALISVGGDDEINWLKTAINSSLLVAGTNVVAVEIHQQSLASSDLSFNGRLTYPSTVAIPVVTRGAYLQKLSPNSITVRWRTDTPCNTYVQYGTSIAYGDVVSNPNLVIEHEITLTGLIPNTKYFYSIGTTTQTLQGDLKNNFYTAPIVGSTIPVRIWGIGDFGNGTTNQLNVRNSYMNYTGSTPTNLWIWLGDDAYTSGEDAEFQSRVFGQYPDQFKNMPLFPTMGNHDYGNLGYQSATTFSTNFAYFSIFSLPQNGESGGVPSNSPKYYSYDYANIHFITLDSYGSLNNPGSPMYTWLANDLAANTQHWTVVYMHHPPYTQGTHDSDTELELIDMRTNIAPLLESYKVDLVLSGHSHVNERSYFIKGHFGNANTFSEAMKVSPETNNFTKSSTSGGTVYAVCGTSGQNPEIVNQPGYPMPVMYFSNNTNNCSLVIDVYGDDLSCKYLASTGSIVDEFSINKASTTNFKRLAKEQSADDKLNIIVSENSINFDYTINDESKVNIDLYNILGEKIMSFKEVPNIQKKGNYNFDIPVLNRSLSKGLYFIKMTVNDKSIVKKVYFTK